MFVIFGAGPVGLAAAAILAKHGHAVDVYEALAEIPRGIESSYPIGINPRALKCLETIDPELKKDALSRGMLIDAWDIYGGESRVAHLESKVVHGTSRGDINALLDSYVSRIGKVTIHFGHRITSLESSIATFSNGLQIDLTGKRIIGCDGVNSLIRQSMKSSTAKLTPWTKRFRVLFSPPADGLRSDLDPAVHYIINGVYCATVKDENGLVFWSCVLGVGSDLSQEDQNLLTSNDPSPENITALRGYITRTCPKCLSLFPDNSDFEKFFGRRLFGGSVVEVSSLNEGEEILLMGDACHSVLPPTGEGINSGLEDVSLLNLLLADDCNSKTLFADFNSRRIKDVQALGRIAVYLNENLVMKGPEAASRLGFTIGQAIGKSMCIYGPGYEDLTFGPEAVEMRPYGEIVDMWERRKKILLPCCRCCCYPCFPSWWCTCCKGYCI